MVPACLAAFGGRGADGGLGGGAAVRRLTALPLLIAESAAAGAVYLPLIWVMGGGRDLTRLLTARRQKRALRA